MAAISIISIIAMVAIVTSSVLNSLMAVSSAIALLAVTGLGTETQDVLSIYAYPVQFAMEIAATAIPTLTMCGARSRAMFLPLAQFAVSRAVVLMAQFTVAITMAGALSKRMICCSKWTNGEWRRSAVEMESNTCGGK